MTPLFLLLAGVTIGGAAAAVGLRNPVHCALSLVATFTGLAGIYLRLGAQFLGLAQVLVYIGAVAILLVFVLLVTRSGTAEAADARGRVPRDLWGVGLLGALAIGTVLGAAVMSAGALPVREAPPELPSVRDLGEALMTGYVIPLQVVGVLLTVAMIGAAVLALREGRPATRVSVGKGPRR